MNSTLLRTLQIGIALIVITAVSLAALLVLGFLDQSSALRIGLNVSAVIGLCMVGGVALGVVFGFRGPTDNVGGNHQQASDQHRDST